MERPVDRLPGTWDDASPADQMRAIDLALTVYFGTGQWIRELPLLRPEALYPYEGVAELRERRL